MTEPGPKTGELDPTPGLAGGPGPTPPGVDDGTPKPALEGARDPAPREPDSGAEEGSQEAKDRPRTARRDPEEPDPS